MMLISKKSLVLYWTAARAWVRVAIETRLGNQENDRHVIVFERSRGGTTAAYGRVC